MKKLLIIMSKLHNITSKRMNIMQKVITKKLRTTHMLLTGITDIQSIIRMSQLNITQNITEKNITKLFFAGFEKAAQWGGFFFEHI